jgi:hypothetical protein
LAARADRIIRLHDGIVSPSTDRAL